LEPAVDTDRRDFFISYNGEDKAWAVWIAWTLEAEGYTTFVQAWDCHESLYPIFMERAKKNSAKTIALFSEYYAAAPHCQTELIAAYAADPTFASGQLVPLKVRRCDPASFPSYVRALVQTSLFNKDEADARAALLEVFPPNHGDRPGRLTPELDAARRKPAEAPEFPGKAVPEPDDSPPPNPEDDQLQRDLFRRLLNAFAILLLVGTVSVGLAYFLGSEAIQGNRDNAYWDRMFNANGLKSQQTGFGFGAGLLVEVLRQMVLLLIALIAMPMVTFRQDARRLLMETPVRRLLGYGPRPPGQKMNLDTWLGFLVLVSIGTVAVLVILIHHFYQGPKKLWETQGYRDGRAGVTIPIGLRNIPFVYRCLLPYLVYLVYSVVNYLPGGTLVLTIGTYAGIKELIWMFNWTSEFRKDCDERVVSSENLHRKYKSYLNRMKEMLEKYHALIVFLLTGFTFKVWLDGFNLSPEAYELELYALIVASIPVIVAYLLSTVSYEIALAGSAKRAQDPAAFRQTHCTRKFYGQRIAQSIYLPISCLLVATMAVSFVWSFVIWLTRLRLRPTRRVTIDDVHSE
jgi:hypothetical protein